MGGVTPGPRPLRVGVSGAGEASAEEARVGERLGAALAAHGAVVVTGGLGGVMAAASRGARAAGGLTVGVLPGSDAATANAWVEVPVATGMGHARNVILVHTAEALIAVGGSWGTLSEVALALKIGLPVASVGSWRPERPGHVPPAIESFDEPESAATWALAQAAARRRRC